MTAVAVRMELAEERPATEQLERLAELLGEFDASTGRTLEGHLVLDLTVPAGQSDDPLEALTNAHSAVSAASEACRSVGLQAAVSELTLRARASSQEPVAMWAAHVELDSPAVAGGEVLDGQIDQLTDLLAETDAAVGVNELGFLSVQMQLQAAGYPDAADRATRLVQAAAPRAGLAGARVVQLELFDDPGELERRSAIPPRPWQIRLLTLPQAAERIGVGSQQMRRYAMAGRFGVIRPGNDFLFPEVYVDQEAERRRAAAAASSTASDETTT